MAEPVGIAGTAAGLVSLGLQLYGEISSYLAAYEGRQQDLDFAKLQCDNLKRCIDAINSAALPRTSDALTASLQSCQKELNALNDLVKGLQGPSTPSTTLSKKLREKGKKLAYPFQREGLRELRERLESTVPVLQLATQTLGLDVLLATHVDLGEVKSAVDDVRTITEDTNAGIDKLSKRIECIGISTTQSNEILPIIEERTATTSVLMAQQVKAVSQVGYQVSSHINDSTRTILGGISHIDKRFEKFEEILFSIAVGIASQPNTMNAERGAANPASMQATSDRLLAFADTMERLSKHGSMSRNDMATLIHESSNETTLCNCIEYRAQKHRRLQWGPVTVQAKWRANIRHSSKCAMGKLTKNQYYRSRGFELMGG
ncbi:hypothetical protein CGLO_13105 [Colletotrichum gloeosporioides Cg-14]|uniref:Fungal N-terminal domain-containing protein n=1 Tax=Colletotrichum gloeosporioides (strain Cg-14) TaxID=1237896 RepID=T0K4D2_COLGC|nr:hypothetical protein CGLO_13105 [Colletotrichum gloeosporioides Cg-14]